MVKTKYYIINTWSISPQIMTTHPVAYMVEHKIEHLLWVWSFWGHCSYALSNFAFKWGDYARTVFGMQFAAISKLFDDILTSVNEAAECIYSSSSLYLFISKYVQKEPAAIHLVPIELSLFMQCLNYVSSVVTLPMFHHIL